MDGMAVRRCIGQERVESAFRAGNVPGMKPRERKVVKQGGIPAHGCQCPLIERACADRIVAPAVDLADRPERRAIVSRNDGRIRRYPTRIQSAPEHDQNVGLLQEQGQLARGSRDRGCDESESRFGVIYRESHLAGQEKHFRITRVCGNQCIAQPGGFRQPLQLQQSQPLADLLPERRACSSVAYLAVFHTLALLK